MNSIELAKEIKRIENEMLSADINSKAELSIKYHEKLKALSEIMELENKAEPFFSAEELLSKPEPVLEIIRTGIKVIDENLGGLVKGAFIQLAAASGAGKTTTMVKILSSLALRTNVVHFDFEMGQIKLYRILKRYLTTVEQRRNYKIDTTHYNLNDLINRIKLGIKMGIEMFVIDSKMKIVTDEKDIYKSSTLISSELSRLTREYNVTIVLINQMSEDSIKNGYPSLKGSGDQVYDSDLIFFLSRIQMKQTDENGSNMVTFDQTKRKLYCAKNRFGELFDGIVEKAEIDPYAVEVNVIDHTEIEMDVF